MTTPRATPTLTIAYAEDPYVAGACNIGAWEIRRRRAIGLLGIAVGVVLLAGLIAAGVPAWVRLVTLLPFWGGAFSLLQARRRFCAAFAMAGLANFGEGEGTRRKVTDEAAHRADLAAVARMTRDSFLIAAALAVVAVLLPV